MKAAALGLLLLSLPAAASDVDCSGLLSAQTVSRICGHPFQPSQNSLQSGSRHCSVELISAEFGSKYGAKGVSPIVGLKKEYKKPGKRNMAKWTYEQRLAMEKGRGNVLRQLDSPGIAAFQAKVSTSRLVFWYQGDHFYTLNVEDGHGGDSQYKPYCPPDKLSELANEIAEEGG